MEEVVYLNNHIICLVIKELIQVHSLEEQISYLLCGISLLTTNMHEKGISQSTST